MIDLDRPATQAAFGALVGIGQSAVSDLVRRGVLREGDPAGDWLRAYCEHLRGVAAGRVETSPELTEQRTRVAKARADREELSLARDRGELCDVAGVQAAAADIGATAMSAFESVPDRIAAQLAAESDPAKCHALVADELRHTVETFRAGLLRMAEARKAKHA